MHQTGDVLVPKFRDGGVEVVNVSFFATHLGANSEPSAFWCRMSGRRLLT